MTAKLILSFGTRFFLLSLTEILTIGLPAAIALSLIMHFIEKKNSSQAFCLDSKLKIINFREKMTAYDDIKEIVVREFKAFTNVRLKKKKGWPTNVNLSVSTPSEKQLLIDSLKEVSTLISIKKETSYARIRILVSIFIVFLCMGGALHEYYYFNSKSEDPLLKVTPIEIKWLPDISKSSGSRHRFNNINFFIPSGYSKKDSSYSSSLAFKNETDNTSILVNKGIYQSLSDMMPDNIRNRYFFPLLGISSSRDLYEWIYNARIGMMPILYKSIDIMSYDSLEIEKFSIGSYYGFIKKGAKDGSKMIEVTLVDLINGGELNFTFISAVGIDESIVKMVVDGVIGGKVISEI